MLLLFIQGNKMKISLNKLPLDYINDVNKAVNILKSAGCSEIYIFGSLVSGLYKKTSDIDLAVKGLPKKIFFKISGKLMMELEHRFDLVELDDEDNNFSKFILENEVFIRVA